MASGIRIFVDPSVNIYYASYYLEGIRRIYGKRSVNFDSTYFRDFGYNGLYMPMVVRKNGQLIRIIIDFGDICDVNHDAYQWCDQYAKINIAFGDLEKFPKLFSIGPSFGICVYSKAETLWYALTNFVKARKRIRKPKLFFSDYRAQSNRYKLHRYDPANSSRDEIFFASSLWKSEPVTNRFRANFIKACRAIPTIKFTGGFSPRSRNDIPGFEELTMSAREDFHSYVTRSKRSMVVFNTPAVGLCHGWKLGEFLAMGKAILTTPLTRELPETFVHQKHVLITDGSVEDIARQITKLQQDPELQAILETSARDYFDRWLLPETVIKLILDHAFSARVTQ